MLAATIAQSITRALEAAVCESNDDCIRGHQHDGPCRLPSWMDDADRPDTAACKTCHDYGVLDGLEPCPDCRGAA